MPQLKQPGFLKKIENAISAIPGLEDQLFSCRKKRRSDNPLVFIDRKDEERILMNLLQRQYKDEKQAAKIECLFQKNKLSPYSILSFIYWRYTKKIYRLSDDIISDVASTYVDNIPAQVLKELPAWSIYVSAEDLHTELPTSYPINGFFFYPLYNNDGNIIRLFIIDDLKQGQGISGLKEKDVDVVGNIIRIKDSREGLIDSRTMECIDGEVVVTVNEEIKDFREREFNLLNAQLSMVLYICSQINDIREISPLKRPQKNKRLVQLDHESPATVIREWDVGIRMGQAIRQFRQSETAGETRPATTSSKRPHIRRGHWHTYWTGSRKPELAHERKPKLKWLPPVPVNSEDVDGLPVVITPLEK
ncbi:protein finQ [Kosakonia sp. MUSA4]|uniref:AcrVA2 family anti-CRISPR protein n=1 Tax=Kosakonia sp. MUSA4 TaxID=2067958 RepID=UPI00159A23FA|nr:protein finQ [Kosakonia sp. MUSA4]QJT82322.1 protein finQ [Kosakonia sp. MUSA4]